MKEIFLTETEIGKERLSGGGQNNSRLFWHIL